MAFSLKDFSLAGKVALVTGGSRGIGKAIALGFASAGADVVVSSRKLPDLEAVAAEIKALGRRSLAVAAHAGRLEDIGNLVSKAHQEMGRIDILVNNAATNPAMDQAIDATERAWDSVMNLNLKGMFFLSQAVAKLMKEQGGGSIVNIASVEGITPGPLPVYGISKAGAIHAARVMAKEWAPFNIRVNVVAPGLTRTGFSEFLWSNPEILSMATSTTPMSLIAEPDEIVGAAVYFASSASSFVTGQVLPVDGGFTI
jgi:NAD(P)-dependent dehydrogenase (short-subunit alcohol dehydrogenase family)